MRNNVTAREPGSLLVGAEGDLLIVDEIAHELRVSPERVRRMILNGELPAEDMASPNAKKRLWRVRRQDLEAFRASRRTQAVGENRQDVRPCRSRKGKPLKNWIGL